MAGGKERGQVRAQAVAVGGRLLAGVVEKLLTITAEHEQGAERHGTVERDPGGIVAKTPGSKKQRGNAGVFGPSPDLGLIGEWQGQVGISCGIGIADEEEAGVGGLPDQGEQEGSLLRVTDAPSDGEVRLELLGEGGGASGVHPIA